MGSAAVGVDRLILPCHKDRFDHCGSLFRFCTSQKMLTQLVVREKVRERDTTCTKTQESHLNIIKESLPMGCRPENIKKNETEFGTSKVSYNTPLILIRDNKITKQKRQIDVLKRTAKKVKLELVDVVKENEELWQVRIQADRKSRALSAKKQESKEQHEELQKTSPRDAMPNYQCLPRDACCLWCSLPPAIS